MSVETETKKSVSLTLTDRYNIVTYANLLPCTLAVRMNIDTFIDMLSISPEEEVKGEVTYTADSLNVGNDFTKTYNTADFPEVILDAIRDYIDRLEFSSKAPNATVLANTYKNVKSSLGLLV